VNDNFTIESYIKILKTACNLRQFITFSQVESADMPSVLWRHDIDVSLRAAEYLANLDREYKARSNFFVNIHSDTYNARSSSGRKSIVAISKLGHRIDVHLDSRYYGGFETSTKLEDCLYNETEVFLNEFGLAVDTFSFHNPSSGDLVHTEAKYAGLFNCYSEQLFGSVPYISDSNGYWRFRSISEFVSSEGGPILQILTHPECWSDIPLAPRERISRALILDVRDHIKNYDDALRSAARENRSVLNPDRLISYPEMIRETIKASFPGVFGR